MRGGELVSGHDCFPCTPQISLNFAPTNFYCASKQTSAQMVNAMLTASLFFAALPRLLSSDAFSPTKSSKPSGAAPADESSDSVSGSSVCAARTPQRFRLFFPRVANTPRAVAGTRLRALDGLLSVSEGKGEDAGGLRNHS